jgi:transposase
MIIIGCDFHPGFQRIAYLEEETGEYGERRLSHPAEAEQFYRALQGKQVQIGIEATGNYRWFRRRMAELHYDVQLGDAAEIRASNPRRQKTDKRDARHILKLLWEKRFPAIWQPPVENEHLRQLLLHRCRMVRMRTHLINQLDSIFKNEGVPSCTLRSSKHRQQLQALPLTGWYERRRADLLELLEELNKRVKLLDQAVQQAAEQNQQACLLMSHPGVGPVLSLAYVLTIGDWRRFPRGKKLASYLGLIPSEDSSANKRRLGSITKQGSSMLRWLLVEAAASAQRFDSSWHRQYIRLSINKHHGVAKLAIAHKLAVRLYWMLRSGQDYTQIRERSSHAGQSE